MGLALIAMSLTTFFRDFLHLIPIILQAWYFASPIMVSGETSQNIPSIGWVITMNPLTYFMAFFHLRLFLRPLSRRVARRGCMDYFFIAGGGQHFDRVHRV